MFKLLSVNFALSRIPEQIPVTLESSFLFFFGGGGGKALYLTPSKLSKSLTLHFCNYKDTSKITPKYLIYPSVNSKHLISLNFHHFSAKRKAKCFKRVFREPYILNEEMY